MDEVCPLQVGLAGPQIVDFLVGDEGITLSDVVSELGVLGIRVHTSPPPVQSWNKQPEGVLQVRGQWGHLLRVILPAREIGQEHLKATQVRD